jgi:hypothetical protein
MPTPPGTKSPYAGRLKAAGNKSPSRFWPELVAKLRAYAGEHGTRVGDFAHIEVSATKLFRDEFGLGGSHVRAIQVLQRARVMVLLKHGVGGRHGVRASTIWAVDMARSFELREFIEASEAIYQDQQRERQRRAREARLAGPDVGEQTTGGPVETRHFHAHDLTHEHKEGSGLHHHLYPDKEGEGEPYPVWVKFRHHTHAERTTNGTVTREITDELAGGRAAMLERSRVAPAARPGETVAENQHRRLMELIVQNEARIAELEEANRQVVIKLAAEREKVEELETLLETVTNPAAAETEAFLAEREP